MGYTEDIQALWYYFKIKTTNTYYRKPIAVNYSYGRVPFLDRLYYFFNTSKLLSLFFIYCVIINVIGIMDGSLYKLVFLICILPALINNFPSVWLNRPLMFGDCPSHLKNPER